MAISEDLRSIEVVLGTLPGLSHESDPIVRLVCSNLQALAEQVESLENLPLYTRELGRRQLSAPQRLSC